jgi:hypothetical protein
LGLSDAQGLEIAANVRQSWDVFKKSCAGENVAAKWEPKAVLLVVSIEIHFSGEFPARVYQSMSLPSDHLN